MPLWERKRLNWGRADQAGVAQAERGGKDGGSGSAREDTRVKITNVAE